MSASVVTDHSRISEDPGEGADIIHTGAHVVELLNHVCTNAAGNFPIGVQNPFASYHQPDLGIGTYTGTHFFQKELADLATAFAPDIGKSCNGMAVASGAALGSIDLVVDKVRRDDGGRGVGVWRPGKIQDPAGFDLL